jgi:hypothetical protein
VEDLLVIVSMPTPRNDQDATHRPGSSTPSVARGGSPAPGTRRLTLLQRLANCRDPGSLGNLLRQRRFEKFRALTEALPRPLRILDVGGTNQFWELRGWTRRRDVHITLLNLRAEPRLHENVESLAGDATALPQFGDQSFDAVFSNSVIEHLFTWENQERMAAEVRRVGRAYWVQSPNYWFPLEPHFHTLGWQWMPKRWRYALIQRRRRGWRGPASGPEHARLIVDELRLVTASEMQRLFPEATLWGERLGGLVKSWVAFHGFQAA